MKASECPVGTCVKRKASWSWEVLRSIDTGRKRGDYKTEWTQQWSVLSSDDSLKRNCRRELNAVRYRNPSLVPSSCPVSRFKACFEARGNESERVSSGHLRDAQSELKLGAFTERSSRVREPRDNKSDLRDGMNERRLFFEKEKAVANDMESATTTGWGTRTRT